jgi:hypothetical protein
MDELAGEQAWNLEKHLSGCLVGYQTGPTYGAAVYFALEALWGIAQDGEVRAKTGKLDPDQLDADWTIACLYRKPKPGRSGDEVRQGLSATQCFRSAGRGERPVHL